MDRARFIAARAKLHEALDELLDALESRDSTEDAAPSPPKSKPRRVTRRRGRLPVAPVNHQVSDLERAAVRAELRMRGGFVEIKR